MEFPNDFLHSDSFHNELPMKISDLPTAKG